MNTLKKFQKKLSLGSWITQVINPGFLLHLNTFISES